MQDTIDVSDSDLVSSNDGSVGLSASGTNTAAFTSAATPSQSPSGNISAVTALTDPSLVRAP